VGCQEEIGEQPPKLLVDKWLGSLHTPKCLGGTVPRRKNSDPPLTALELEIMKVLWDSGQATVQTVQGNLKDGELAYTTVQTMLNVLHRKGKVKRTLIDRAYVYNPLLSRQKAVTQAVGDMLDRFFGGSADSLVLNLLETRQLDPRRVSELKKLFESEKKHGND
jgi:BlaI family transcriptional regulator, penicillinase repressor